MTHIISVRRKGQKSKEGQEGSYSHAGGFDGHLFCFSAGVGDQEAGFGGWGRERGGEGRREGSLRMADGRTGFRLLDIHKRKHVPANPTMTLVAAARARTVVISRVGAFFRRTRASCHAA